MSTITGIDQEQFQAQHYVFAHYTLREQAFEATDSLLSALTNRDQGYIRDQWFNAMVRCSMWDLPFDSTWFPLEEIHFSALKQREVSCYVISLPEPRHESEVFFVAVVQSSSEDVKYYTLEKGFQNDGTPQTVFCEWTPDGSHLNHGDGPPATVEAFTESIFRFMNGT